ncbi:adenylate/guanylate cyclase domain-containing protein [Fodinibius sp. Rm-B-1B1-1]|uniref:adenylate/guanylate cyclase domain-containing protein n=1 Tax=Fodinibius alkaliphilus TaxID=3140241 RepID=UPI00315B13E1
MINKRTEHIRWNWKLKSRPKEIWPFVTDTNRLFKDLKQPSVQQAHITQSVKPGFVQLSYNGLNRYEVWEEEPYEWEYPYRFGVVRHYQSGPYKDLKIQVDIKEHSMGCELVVDVWATPRSKVLSFFTTLKLRTLVKGRLKKVLNLYDQLAISQRRHYQVAKPKKLVRGGKKRLSQIKEKLHNSQVDAAVLGKLVEFICRADDLDLQRISPFELADQWGISEKKVFEVFIHAAKADLLNFNWNLYCPHCRSVQESVKTLNQIYEPIYCNHCEQEFKVNFNKTIQLSFTPHPLVRKINPEQYCARGPQEKSHIKVQQYLRPGQKRYIMTDMPAGTYILRTNRSDGTATVHVSDKGSETVHINIGSQGLRGEEVGMSCNPNLSIENTSDKNQLITLEHKEWNGQGVSAARATSSQLFRNVFADEVLRKGEKISVDNLTLMFTDLYDSTAMYNEEGDDKAVSHVIDHFDILHEVVAKEDGAIVKTIGDSVMAVFCDPTQALRSYLRAQLMIAEDDRFNDDFQLKAGIHHGSCVAVNLNSRIDYFGSTVNIASRFVDFASEDELIVSGDIFERHELQAVLDEFGKHDRIEDVSTQLRGFDKESFAIKRIQISDSPLRLAI